MSIITQDASMMDVSAAADGTATAVIDDTATAVDAETSAHFSSHTHNRDIKPLREKRSSFCSTSTSGAGSSLFHLQIADSGAGDRRILDVLDAGSPPPIAISAHELYAVLQDMNRRLDESATGSADDMQHNMARGHDMQRTLSGLFAADVALHCDTLADTLRTQLDDLQRAWTPDLLKQRTLPPSVLLHSPPPIARHDSGGGGAHRDELERFFHGTLSRVRRWLLRGNIARLLDGACALVSFTGISQATAATTTTTASLRTTLERILLLIVDHLDYTGLAHIPTSQCIGVIEAERLLLSQMRHVVGAYVELSLRHFELVVARQSKFRVMSRMCLEVVVSIHGMLSFDPLFDNCRF